MEQTELQQSLSTTNEHIVTEYYDSYKDVQQDILQTETSRTRNAIFIVAALLFGSDLLALLMTNALNGTSFLYILIVPILFAGVALSAKKQPLAAVTIAIVLYVGIWGLSVLKYGASQLMSGLIVKAVIVFFLLKAFGNAREAEKAKKNLKAA